MRACSARNSCSSDSVSSSAVDPASTALDVRRFVTGKFALKSLDLGRRTGRSGAQCFGFRALSRRRAQVLLGRVQARQQAAALGFLQAHCFLDLGLQGGGILGASAAGG
jgi:hypothetical protein